MHDAESVDNADCLVRPEHSELGVEFLFSTESHLDFVIHPCLVLRVNPCRQYLIVSELVAGITILDTSDRPAATLGFQSGADHQAGWPNERRSVREGLFNSPHSATADAAGNIYVVEWITGGRVTKLERI